VIDEQNAFTASSFLEELEKARPPEPAHSRPTTAQAYVPPTDEVERRVASIWQELFGINRVGIHDNFFDLGGNSLLAIQLVSQLRKAFEVDLPMSKLFESPTVSDLARGIKAGQQEQEELEEISRILDEIEGLSLDEVQTRLAEEP
jgi:acyl carrier protein